MFDSSTYIDFVDGCLNDNQEREFFLAMANDSELLSGFKTFLLVTQTISNNIKAFGPSINETSALYKKLGFTMPAEMLAESPVPTATKSLLLGKWWSYLTVGILSSLITYLLLNFVPNQIIEQKKLANFSSSTNFQNHDKTNISSKITASNSNKVIPTKSAPRKVETVNPIILANLNKENLLRNEQNLNPEYDVINENESNQEFYSKVINNSLVFLNDKSFLSNNQNSFGNTSSSNSKIFLLQDTIMLFRTIDSRMVFEFKNTPSWYFTEPEIKQTSPSKFDNIDFAVYYPIYDGLLLGLDLKQESYYIVYDGKDDKGQKAMLIKYPTLTSVGFSGRYSLFDFTPEIKPIIQLGVAINPYGFISREMLGLEYYPYDYVYMMAGAELNQFFFSHENNWFNSNKFNFNFGIGFKF